MAFRLHSPLSRMLRGAFLSKSFAGLLLLGLHGSPVRVHADDQTHQGERGDKKDGAMLGEVLVLLATGEEGSVDPSLGKLRALKHAPFNEYKTIKLLSKNTVTLPMDQPVEVDLPKRRKLVLRLVAKLPDGRAKVQLSISRANQKDYLPLLHVISSADEPFFVAGQKFEGGTLVIGVRVGEHLRALL